MMLVFHNFIFNKSLLYVHDIINISGTISTNDKIKEKVFRKHICIYLSTIVSENMRATYQTKSHDN